MPAHRSAPLGEASRLAGRLWIAARHFDEPLAVSTLSRAFAVFGPGEVADRVVVPVMQRLGDTWRDDDGVVPSEHFTSQLVRGQYQSRSTEHQHETGPLAIGFSPDQDQHDLGVHLAAGALRAAGWRVRVLGATTPTESARHVITELRPDLLVVGAGMREAAEDFLASGLAELVPTIAGGCGFDPEDLADVPHATVHLGRFSALPAVAQRLRHQVAGSA